MPRPSRSFTVLPQISRRTLSRDTSSSTNPGSDTGEGQEGLFLFCFLTFSLTDSSSPSHPAPPPPSQTSLKYVPILCPTLTLWVLPRLFLFSVTLFILILVFQPPAFGLHFNTKSKNAQQHDRGGKGIASSRHLVFSTRKDLVHIQTVVRNCTLSFFCIYIRSTSMMCHPIILPSIRAIPLP